MEQPFSNLSFYLAKLIFKYKELWIKFPKLKLIDYGFHWKEDPRLKNCCDNHNWFLFQKLKK